MTGKKYSALIAVPIILLGLLGTCCITSLLPSSPEKAPVEPVRQPEPQRQATVAPKPVKPVKAPEPVSDTADIRVRVQEKKSNGKAWDALGGKPDIAICVSTSRGKRCYPSMRDDPSFVNGSECSGSFTCEFSDIYIGEGVPVIEVVDSDAAMTDPVGSGKCARGGVCTLGLATVEIDL